MSEKKVFRRFLTWRTVCIMLAIGAVAVIAYFTVADMITALAFDHTSSVDPTHDISYYGGTYFYDMPHYYDWDLHWLGGSNVVPLHHP